MSIPTNTLFLSLSVRFCANVKNTEVRQMIDVASANARFRPSDISKPVPMTSPPCDMLLGA